MAQEPIVLYVAETGGQVYVGGSELLEAIRQAGKTEEDFLAATGAKRHEITLVPRPQQWMQEQVERDVTVYNPATGIPTIEESRRFGAMVNAYVEGWTFLEEATAIPPNAEGFRRLHPAVASRVGQELNARLFRGFANSPDFFSLFTTNSAKSLPPTEKTD